MCSVSIFAKLSPAKQGCKRLVKLFTSDACVGSTSAKAPYSLDFLRSPILWRWSKLAPLQPLDHTRHFEGGPRCFGPAVMFRPEATHSRLVFILENEHPVNHGYSIFDLNLRERMADRVTDVLRVAGFALENHAETNDGRKRRHACMRQFRRHRRNFK